MMEKGEYMSNGALDGLRVIDLTDDSGRFATKVLNELGADVVRVSSAGSPGSPMQHADAAALGGVLDWWYDGGKRKHTIDLSTIDGQQAYRQLATAADLIIDTEPAGRLAELGLDWEPGVLEGYARASDRLITGPEA